MVLLLLLLAVLVSEAAAWCAESPEPGPLRVREHYALGQGFLAFVPTPVRVLAAGRWQLDAILSVSNTWSPSPPLEIELESRSVRAPVTTELLERLAVGRHDGGLMWVDGEVSRAVIAVRRGFSKRFEVEATLPLVAFGGGILDGAVEGFHSAFGVNQAGRQGAPKDDFRIYLDSRRGLFVAESGPGFGIGNITLGAKYQIKGRPKTRYRLSISGLVKLPTADQEPIATSGAVDVGLRVLAARDFGKWSIHGSGGILYLGRSEGLNLDAQTVISGMAAVERRVGRRSSLVLQTTVSDSPFEDLAVTRIGLSSAQMTGGVKVSVGSKNQLFAGVTENVDNFTNSADVSLHVGLTRSLR